jgi:hypothetical protein
MSKSARPANSPLARSRSFEKRVCHSFIAITRNNKRWSASNAHSANDFRRYCRFLEAVRSLRVYELIRTTRHTTVALRNQECLFLLRVRLLVHLPHQVRDNRLYAW